MEEGVSIPTSDASREALAVSLICYMSVFCYISVNAAFSIGAHVLGTGIGQNAYSLRNSRNSRVRRGTLIQSREQPLAVGPSVWNGHSLVARRCNALGGAWSRSVASATSFARVSLPRASRCRASGSAQYLLALWLIR